MPARRTTCLVLGFPSWIAKSVVREIAQEADGAVVHVLVTPDQRGAADAFLGDLRSLDSAVSIVEGDPVRMDLGLPGATFVALARDLDVAVNLYDVSPLPDAPRTAGYGGLYGKLGEPADLTVRAAREAIEIASAAPRLRHLVQLGSLTVAGAHRGVWTEEDLSVGQRHRTTAERCRHGAERLLWRRRSSLPFTTIRVGVVLGDSRTGEIDWYHGPHDLVELLLFSERSPARSVLPGASPALNVVPSDHVAGIVRAIAMAPPERSGALNLVPPRVPSLAEFQCAVRAALDAAASRGPVPEPPRALRQRLGRRYGASPTAIARAVARLDTPAACTARRAREIERRSGLRFPDLPAYLPGLVAHALARAAAEAHGTTEAVPDDALDR